MTEIETKLASRTWYHAFELLPGIVTPGSANINPGARLDSFNIQKNLSGKIAVDVGTWDGPVAFALEKRGARVFAVDIQDPDKTGFNIAKEIISSRVEYIRCSVYDLPKMVQEKADIVMFGGVFYHLKSPILAFEAIAEIMSPTGNIYFEGEIIGTYAETLLGAYDKTLDIKSIAESNVPICLCYPGAHNGSNNWHIPNIACVMSWIKAAGLHASWYKTWDNPKGWPPSRRIYGCLQKQGAPRLEHDLVGETMWGRS